MTTAANNWSNYLLGIVASLTAALVVGAIVSYGRMMAMDERVSQNQTRMDAMEQGLTTPMSVVTRERFDALEKRLIRIEERIERLVDQFHALQGVKREKLPKRDAVISEQPPDVGG